MARVFIDDLWLRNASDGTPPSRAAEQSLANARDPMRAGVPEKWRSTRYGVGARWRCRWYVTGRDGRRMQRSKSFSRLRDAEEYATAMEDDIRSGRYRDPRQERRPFREVADRWLESKLDLRPGTCGRYRRELRVYINPKWGGTPLKGITRDGLQRWVADLMEGEYPAELPDGRRPRPLSPRSIRNIVSVVTKGALDYAVEQGWIQSNPADKINLPRIVRTDDDMTLLSVDEVELLADMAGQAGGEVDALLVRWQAYTGCRIGETLALRVGDVDLERRRARVSRTWTDDGHGGQMIGPPKNGRARSVAIPHFLCNEIGELMDGREQEDWLFRAPRGGNIWLHNWRSRVWSKAVRLAGMEGEGVTIHSLRHTYASYAIAAGADVKTLQAQLGHASATITLDTYAALWPERLDDCADAVEALRERMLED